VDLLTDIVDYWIELLGTEDKFHMVTQFTIQILRQHCEGDKRHELENDTFRSLFLRDPDDPHGTLDGTFSDIIFPGADETLLERIFHRFVRMTKHHRGIRSFQSLNTGTKNTLEHFYHIIEHVAYLYDSTARAGYKGGKTINTRPRVESSLISKFGKREYYAIMFYCITHWKEMKSTSTYRPHEALGLGQQKEIVYWGQYQHKYWFQLAWCLIKQWKVPPADFSALELKLDGIRKLEVITHIIYILPFRESRMLKV
jgi:hypothetical protein